MGYQRVSVDQMADVIMEELNKFSETGIEEVKKAVKKGGKIVKDDINASAPVRTGSMPSRGPTRSHRRTPPASR